MSARDLLTALSKYPCRHTKLVDVWVKAGGSRNLKIFRRTMHELADKGFIFKNKMDRLSPYMITEAGKQSILAE